MGLSPRPPRLAVTLGIGPNRVGLQRCVVVLAGLEPFAFVDQGSQGVPDDRTGLGRFDHGVDESALGGDVRVQQSLGVVGLERSTLVGGGPPLENGGCLESTSTEVTVAIGTERRTAISDANAAATRRAVASATT